MHLKITFVNLITKINIICTTKKIAFKTSKFYLTNSYFFTLALRHSRPPPCGREGHLRDRERDIQTKLVWIFHRGSLSADRTHLRVDGGRYFRLKNNNLILTKVHRP